MEQKKTIKINVKFFILLAFAAMLVNAMGQEKDEKTNPFPALAIANEKINVLYTIYPNLVRIAASVNPQKLHIDWGGATAVCTGIGRYNVSVPDSLADKEITITVYTETKKGKIQNLEKVTFRVKAAAEPIAFVGGNISGGNQYKEVLLANPFISARMVSPYFNYDLPWKVSSYKVTFTINEIAEEPITVEGAKFSEEVINKIKDAPHGTIVEFSQIKVQSIAGRFDIRKAITIRIIETKENDK